jgi:hypothetical protein
MSLGTDQGFLMSPELLRVAERAQHDPKSGGRHPGILTPDQDQGVVLRGPCLSQRLVTVSTSLGAYGDSRRACQTATAFLTRKRPKRVSGAARLLQRRSRVVEISLLGSEGARAGNRPGYPTCPGKLRGPKHSACASRSE